MSYTVTVNVYMGMPGVGHASITLTDANGNSLTVGYYPGENPGEPTEFASSVLEVPGTEDVLYVNDWSGQVKDERERPEAPMWSRTETISEEQYNAMYQHVQEVINNPGAYAAFQFGGENCASFVSGTLDAGNVSGYGHPLHPYAFISGNIQISPDSLYSISVLEQSVLDFDNAEDTYISPIILDLDGDGVETIGVNAGAYFDHDGNGFAEQTGWVGADDGLLVWDRNADGRINDGKELFGNETLLGDGTKAANGYAALVELDTNADGVVDANDAAFASLKVWQDADGDGYSSASELKTLAELNIQSINTDSTASTYVDPNSNTHKFTGSFTKTDGTVGSTADVWFQTDTLYTIQEEYLAVSADIAALPDLRGYGNVYDLQQAIVRDASGSLRSLVESFMATTDANMRSGIMEQVLFKWTGTDTVDPSSRGPYMDARRLATLERFFGQSYVGSNGSTGAAYNTVSFLNQSWRGLFELTYAQLTAQTHLAPLYDLIAYSWNAAALRIEPDFTAVKSDIASRYAADPLATDPLVAEFRRTIIGLGQEQTWLSSLRDNDPEFAWTLDSAGFSRVEGTALGDLLSGTTGAEAINGGDGNDSLSGLGGDDLLYGASGDDILDGGEGNDLLYGGLGNDTITDTGGSNTIDAGAGNDTVTLTGSNPYDNNTVYGGDGDDVITSGATTDTIYGGAGNDTISAGESGNTVYGEAGNDNVVVHYASGSFLHGGSGDDTLRISQLTSYEAWYSDYYNSTTLFEGGTGNDVLQGSTGTDTYVFNRGDGQDLIRDNPLGVIPGAHPYGTPSDEVRFGMGITAADLTAFKQSDDLVIRIADPGNPLATDQLTFEKWYLSPLYRIETFTFADGSSVSGDQMHQMASTITGTDGNDVLVGGSGNDIFNGMSGDDILTGYDGNDLLNGGTGADTMFGGTGDDAYVVDNAGDVITELASEGTDTARASITYTLGDNVENLTLMGSAKINGTGNGLDNVLVGNGANNILQGMDGNDTLSGGANADTMFGGTGDDTYVVDNINDAVLENLNEGADTVQSEINYVLAGNVENLTLIGSSAINGTGNELDNRLVGNNSNNTLYALGGNDTLTDTGGSNTIDAGAGNDTVTLTGSNPYDNNTVYGGDGDDVITSGATTDTIYGGNGNDTIDAGESGNTVDGEAGNDIVTVHYASHSTLKGGSGNDTLRVSQFTAYEGWYSDYYNTINIFDGGAGNDVLQGSAGTDTYIFNRGDGQDMIRDNLLGISPGTHPYGTPCDTVRFGVGIAVADLTAFKQGDDLLVRVADPSNALAMDQLTFEKWFLSPVYRIESFAFADGSGLSSSEVEDIIYTPVVAIPLANYVVPEDSAINIVIPSGTFSDPNNDVLAYTAMLCDGSPLPFWLGFDAATGTFLGTPTNGDVGTLSIRIIASDPTGLSVSADFSLTVANVNDAPTVASVIVDQNAVEDAVFNFTLPVGTFADIDVGDSLGYAATLADGSALPGWLTFNSSARTFTGTPTNDDVGSFAVRVTATDSGGASISDVFTLSVANVNDAPVVANAIASQVATEDSAWSFQVPAGAFADADVGDTLMLGVSLSDGSALPDWLAFDSLTGTFTGTPGNADVGALAVRVTATDASGAAVSQVFTLTVANTNDAPVVANPVPDQNVAEGGAFSYTVPADTFSDIDAGDTLSYNATLADGSALPAWLAFDAATRTFSGTPANGYSGVYDIRIIATDTAGLSVSDVFSLTIADTLSNVFTGTSSADALNGTVGADTLQGLGGNDTLYGYAGNDMLDGGNGSDTMVGGMDNDTYVVNANGDVVVENVNEGTDTVQSSFTYSLSANVENLVLTGTGKINGTGNSLDNVLTGNSANNILTGGAGNDTLDGGAGSDTLRGGTGNDVYVVDSTGDVATENANEGTDTVHAGIAYTLGGSVENLTLTGGNAINGTGNALSNVLTGNSANNTLTGDAGDDSLYGGAGNDVLNGGIGNDIYAFGRGDGQDVINDNDSTAGNSDTATIGVDRLDIVFARSGNDLVMSLHGGADMLTVQSWYGGTAYQTETIRSSEGSTLANTQVEQLIQAMATFSAQNGGITWDQAIDQRPDDVQAILAANWMPAT